MNHLRIATHKNSLSLAQCDKVVALLPHLSAELVPIDIAESRDAYQTAIERQWSSLALALKNSDVDVAVVSAIDLPYPLPSHLTVVALLPSETKTDSLVAQHYGTLAQLPQYARVGALLRRQVDQLLKARPDLDIVLLDDDTEKAIERLLKNDFEALVLPTFLMDLLELGHLAVEELDFETHPLQGRLAVVAQSSNKQVAEIYAPIDDRRKWGEVIIAGFGPGDPGLVTRRSEVWLSLADVIVYDDLIESNYLKKYCATKIYVGKRKGAHYAQQDEINKTMHDNAVAGKRVVRIKGGDPLVFGRGAEEYHFLAERMVKATIIPGVSSAMAAAAAAVVPLTARGVSSSVVFLSGHNLDKLVVPKAETLVFYMGADNQGTLSEKLIGEGWNPYTPVAIVREASKPEQEIRRYTLKSLALDDNPLPSPLIIIVGNSAAEHGESSPKRWLFTGLNVSDFKANGVCVHSPMIAIQSMEMNDDIRDVLTNLARYDRIVFPTRFAVKHFFDCLYKLGLDARSLTGLTITAVGEQTTTMLRKNGILAPAVPANDYADGLLSWFTSQQLQPEKILIPQSSVGLSVLPAGLVNLGHQVTSLAIYQTVMPDNIIRHNLDDFYGVMFTSPSTIDNFMQFYGQIPRHLKIVVRGKEAEVKLGELDKRLLVIAPKNE